MAAVAKIESNITSLFIAEEQTIGVLPGSPIWIPYEPNSYSDFGGSISTVTRKPIIPSRQRKKGTVSDLDAAAGFNSDLVQDGLQSLLQGFLLADFRGKTELSPTAATVTTNIYTVAAGGAGAKAGDLFWAKGFVLAANNGLKVVSASSGTTVTATPALATEAIAAGLATISRVGFQGASGDITMTVAGSVITLGATAKNLTELGLIPGEWIYVGGDLTAEKFATAACNGWARVKSIAASAIVLDKTQFTAVTDSGAAKTIRIFVGRALKNESTTALIKRRTYQLERQLGAPDDASPANIQSEYVIGAVPNELTLNLKGQSKVDIDLSFVGIDSQTRDGVTGVKAGTRKTLNSGTIFNTSSDFSRIKLGLASSVNPSAYIGYFQEITISLKNNVTPNKALAVLGAFDATAGSLEVSASITGYFSDVAAIASIRSNADVTADVIICANNTGMSIDLPLIGLGGGRLQVEQDKPVTIPLTADAATASTLDVNFDHTMMLNFFDYLPNAAM